MESLEDRLALAVLTVNTLADNTTDTSVLTLRDAVALVDNGGDPTALGQSSIPNGWSAQIAGTFGSNDTIQFDPSLLTSTPQTINLGGSELRLSRSMSINGPDASQLAISGNYASRVFTVTSGTTVTLAGLTLEEGQATSVFPNSWGGAIDNEGGVVTVNDCALVNNRAALGGAIFNSGTMAIHDSTLSGNHANDAGAIANWGILTLAGSTVSSNTAYDGGGIMQYRSGTELTVSNSTFVDNHAVWVGGAVIIDMGTVTVDNSSLITGNSAGTFGGGIFNSGIIPYGVPGNLTVADSTVCGNTAPSGADISSYGTLALANSDVCNINQTVTTTTAFSSNSPSVVGQTVTLTANVTYPTAIVDNPFMRQLLPALSGSVTFLLDGNTPLGTVMLDDAGFATLATAAMPVGTHTITAIYSGNASTFASTSDPFSQTVLSAQEELGVIINKVTNLIAAGVLDSGIGNALISKLNSAIASLNNGNTVVSDNQLNALLDQINALMKSGKLDTADAQALVSDIDLALDATLLQLS